VSEAWVWCGAGRLPVARAAAFEPPPALAPVADLGAAVREALTAPRGAPRLRELARGAASVVVTIPDASRPCPSEPVLLALLDELAEGGVGDDSVTVVVGCGLHVATDASERARLAGASVAARVAVVDAQGIEVETADLWKTSLGAPVRIARRVAEADLAVTVGVVEPHLYAGFSGGVKGVAIGCAGHETIAWTHRPAFISLPGVAVGNLADNPFRETLREIAARTPLRFGVNLVVAGDGVAAAAAGDPEAVLSALADGEAGDWLRTTGDRFDVVVAGVHAPKSDNLYQASRAATYLCLAARPALAEGGLLVLCADLPDGAGTGPAERNFLAVLAGAASPAELVARGLREPLGPGGQRSFVVARVLEHYRLAVVGAAEPAFLGALAHLGVAAFDSVDAALAAEDARLGHPARVLTVADGLSTVVTRT
jgi:nickel-dependent lactate racemase